ncbi:MAG: hypothetical protein KY395_07650 [Actinobacteria bacterium]|nr:hypothetical protein [Actinomycetota bacterium]
MSIEVIDGAFGAGRWADAHADSLIEAALRHDASDWEWHRHPWGVVLEVEFADEAAWERYRRSNAVVTALEHVPDPVFGLIIYRGRGGSSGTRNPRRPRPLIGAGAAELPVPEALEEVVTSLSRYRDTIAPELPRRVTVGRR